MSKKLSEKQQYQKLVRRQKASLKLAKSKISTFKTERGKAAQLARVNLLAKKQYQVRMAKFPVLEKFNQVKASGNIIRIVKRDKTTAREYKKYVSTNLNKLYRQVNRAKLSNVYLNLKKISFKVNGGVATVQGLLNWFKYDVPEGSPEYLERELTFRNVLKALKKIKWDNKVNKEQKFNLNSQQKKYSPQFSLGDVSDEINIKPLSLNELPSFDIGSRVFDSEVIYFKQFKLYVFMISQKLVLTDIENTAPHKTTEYDLSDLKAYVLKTFDDTRIDINDYLKQQTIKLGFLFIPN